MPNLGSTNRTADGGCVAGGRPRARSWDRRVSPPRVGRAFLSTIREGQFWLALRHSLPSLAPHPRMHTLAPLAPLAPLASHTRPADTPPPSEIPSSSVTLVFAAWFTGVEHVARPCHAVPGHPALAGQPTTSGETLDCGRRSTCWPRRTNSYHGRTVRRTNCRVGTPGGKERREIHTIKEQGSRRGNGKRKESAKSKKIKAKMQKNKSEKCRKIKIEKSGEQKTGKQKPENKNRNQKTRKERRAPRAKISPGAGRTPKETNKKTVSQPSDCGGRCTLHRHAGGPPTGHANKRTLQETLDFWHVAVSTLQ